MLLNTNIFLLLFGGLQALFLSFVLLKKKIYKNGYTFLLIYLLVMVLQITLKIMSKVWLLQNLQPLYILSYQFPLLYGPLVYLFTKQFIFRKKFIRTDSLHFLPVAIVISYFIFGNAYSKPPLLLLVFFAPTPLLIIEITSIFVYHFLAWKCWNKYQLQLIGYFSEIKKQQLKWLKLFLIISAVVCSVIALIVFLLYMWYPYNQQIRFGFTALTFFVYWISYCAWNQPQIFSVIPGYSNETREMHFVPNLVVHTSAKKYSNSGLNEEQKNRILLKLHHVMEEQKKFLDADITIDKLAENIDCSKHHLSQVLNSELKKSFYDYINFFRVEEAKILLADMARANHKIASIAYDAGFNSLSTFNDIFKKLTGTTPSQFRRQPGKQSQQKRV